MKLPTPFRSRPDPPVVIGREDRLRSLWAAGLSWMVRDLSPALAAELEADDRAAGITRPPEEPDLGSPAWIARALRGD